MNQEKEYEYLMQIYLDLRDEIKMRIAQRNNFALQFIITIGALLGFGFSENKYSGYCLLAIPLTSIYFFVQVFNSYAIHDLLAKFIRENIEVKIAYIMNISSNHMHEYFWERYCQFDREKHKIKFSGINKQFYEYVIFIMPFLSAICFLVKQNLVNQINCNSYITAIISIVVYLIIALHLIYKNDIEATLIQLANIDYKKNKFPFFLKKQKAILIDRDGTIHVDKVETHKISDLEFFDDTFDALKYFKKNHYKIIVITNQSGIGKKHYKKEDMHLFNKNMIKELKKHGCSIDAIYYCPHVLEDNCNCLKPKTGMLERAIKEFNIDIDKSFLIGDKMTDIIAANKMNLKSILVTTGIYINQDYKTEEGYNDTITTVSCLKEAKDKIKSFNIK